MQTVAKVTKDRPQLSADVEKCLSLATTLETLADDNRPAKQASMTCLCDSVISRLDRLKDELDSTGPIDALWHDAVHLFGLANAIGVLIEAEDERVANGLSSTAFFLTEGLKKLHEAMEVAKTAKAAA